MGVQAVPTDIARGTFTEIELAPLTSEGVIRTRDLYVKYVQEQLGEVGGKGIYSENDWRRLEYVLGLLKHGGESLLDVGVGNGQFMNLIGEERLFHITCGIDVRQTSKFVRFSQNFQYSLMDATAMSFPDKAFSVVTCMEVLEHLDDENFQRALNELRRVSRDRLIMSVPFEEPEPLPPYHKQRFTRERILETFPDASYTILHKIKRKGVAWLLIVE